MGFNFKTLLVLLVGMIMSIAIIILAKAETSSDFENSFRTSGIDRTVERALKNGASPYVIISCGIKITSLNSQDLIKALYCSGADGVEIRNAALSHKISEEDIMIGFKESTEDCADFWPNHIPKWELTSKDSQ